MAIGGYYIITKPYRGSGFEKSFCLSSNIFIPHYVYANSAAIACSLLKVAAEFASAKNPRHYLFQPRGCLDSERKEVGAWSIMDMIFRVSAPMYGATILYIVVRRVYVCNINLHCIIILTQVCLQ